MKEKHLYREKKRIYSYGEMLEQKEEEERQKGKDGIKGMTINTKDRLREHIETYFNRDVIFMDFIELYIFLFSPLFVSPPLQPWRQNLRISLSMEKMSCCLTRVFSPTA